MKYALHGQDEHHFHIKHPDGSVFPIMKHGMHPELMQKIQKLADGTPDVEPEEMPWQKAESEGAIGVSEAPQSGQPFSMDQMIASAGPNINATAGINLPQVASNNPTEDKELMSKLLKDNTDAPKLSADIEKQVSQPQNAAGPANYPGGEKAYYSANPARQAFDLERQAVQQGANAQSAMAKEQDRSYRDYNNQMATRQVEYQDTLDTLNKENEVYKKQIQDGHIDPNRLWHNASVGGKIAAAVGLILGGIGQGLTRSNHNAAMDVIQKMIDRDVDAQKSEIGKAHSLLSVNMQRFHNLQMAETATRSQMAAALQAHIARAASQSGSTMAQANAKMALGQIGMQEAQYNQQLADFMTKAKQLGAGSGEGGLGAGSPEEVRLAMTDPKYLEHRIVVGGKAFRAPSPKDAADLRTMQSEVEPVKNMLGELSALQEQGLAGKLSPQNRARAEGIMAFLVPRMNKLHGLTRLSAEDIHLMQKQMTNPNSFLQTTEGKTKNDQLIKMLNEDLESNYQKRLVGYKGMSKFNLSAPVQ